MDGDDSDHVTHDKDVVELTRLQPIEAEVIVAHLRSAGIRAIVGADSVYPSVTVADGVPVLVSARDVARALAVLEGSEPSD
jgi:hypothetical protein